MSDEVPVRIQQSCILDEKYLIKIFTFVDDHGDESVERMLYIYVAREEQEDIFEFTGVSLENTVQKLEITSSISSLNGVEPKDLRRVLSMPFVWKNPKGTLLTAKLSTGGFTSEQQISIARVTEFRFPEKFTFELPKSDAKKLSVDIKLANENRNLWEQNDVKILLLQTKESGVAVEHSWES